MSSFFLLMDESFSIFPAITVCSNLCDLFYCKNELIRPIEVKSEVGASKGVHHLASTVARGASDIDNLTPAGT